MGNIAHFSKVGDGGVWKWKWSRGRVGMMGGNELERDRDRDGGIGDEEGGWMVE